MTEPDTTPERSTPASHHPALALLAAALGIAGTTLVGWWSGADDLTTWRAGTSMRPTTALTLGLLALGGMLTLAGRRVPATTVTVLAGVVSSFILLDLAVPADLRSGHLLPVGDDRDQPLLPAASTALALGTAVVALLSVLRRRVLLLMLSGSIVFGIAYVAVVGYLFDAPNLYTIVGYTNMALPTSVSFLLVATGLLLALPHAPTARLLFHPGSAGRVVRVFLPVLICAPPLLGWFRLQGQELGWYDTRFGIALLAASTSALAVAVTITTALRLERAERDLAERRERLDEARAGRIAADAANTAKSEFLSRMSHELRTPLNAVLGFSQVLELELSDPKQRESVRYILDAGQHLLALIDEVLDISRIESGSLRVLLEPVAVGQALEEALDLVRAMAVERQVRLEPPSGDLAATVDADRHRVRQVLVNLLSNAVKYNRLGGNVSCSVAARDDTVEVRVSDTGVGIPADRRDQLFLAFERLGAERGPVEGTGIGLALSRQLAELMGGVLELDEAEPVTTFVLVLPRRDVSRPGPAGNPSYEE